MILSPGSVKHWMALEMPGTMPGAKPISEAFTFHPWRRSTQSLMASKKARGLTVYPRISCSQRRRIASMMKGGVLKSMSATHRGIRSSRPQRGSSASYFRAPVPRRSITSSKSYCMEGLSGGQWSGKRGNAFFQDDVAVFGRFTGNDDGIGLFGPFIKSVALHLLNFPVIVQRLAVFGFHRRVQRVPRNRGHHDDGRCVGIQFEEGNDGCQQGIRPQAVRPQHRRVEGMAGEVGV